MTIDKSEREDCKAVIRRHGYFTADFEVSTRSNPLVVGGLMQETGKITVRYKKTSVERTYKTGHGTTWVIAFEEDLVAGEFLKGRRSS